MTTFQNRVAAGVPSGGQFAASAKAEAQVALTVPAPSYRFSTMEDLAAAGYVTDEWERWQQGGCAAYAIALVDANPHLRFAVLGETELGDGDASEGWSETHCFAHDDQYAYDSAGRHPLPYRGIEGTSDYAELDSDPDWFGYRDEFDETDFAAARDHAARHRILDGAPVPFGGNGNPPPGLDLATGQWLQAPAFSAKPAPPLAGARRYLAQVDVHDIAWDDYGVYDPDNEIDPPGDETVAIIEDLVDRYTRGEPVDPIQIKPGRGARPYDLHDGWHRIQAANIVGRARPDAILIIPEENR